MARGRRPPLYLDVDQTRPAGAERGPVGILAELRQRNRQPVDRVEDGRAGRDLDVASVDGQLHRGVTVPCRGGTVKERALLHPHVEGAGLVLEAESLEARVGVAEGRAGLDVELPEVLETGEPG